MPKLYLLFYLFGEATGGGVDMRKLCGLGHDSVTVLLGIE